VVKDEQVLKLMSDLSKGKGIGVSAARAGMHRNTAAKYLKSGKLPSAAVVPRGWRTREDAFAEHWPELAVRLEAAPELEAKILFEDLQRRYPGRYEAGQLRTLQRRVQQWRLEHGPEREVMLPQQHRPGEALQTDFVNCNSLGVRIGGERFDHLLCHTVLPYSNWQWATVARSESLLALERGIQEAVFRIGRTPRFSQTDNSTAATHDLRTGKRGFNEEYLSLCERLSMKPRTIAVGKSHQNGDVEALNGALKRRIEQYLLLRGSRDFAAIEEYEEWLWSILERSNVPRAKDFAQELSQMRPVVAARRVEQREMRVRVTANGTIRVQNNTYSVPPRLSGSWVLVRLSDLWVEVFSGSNIQARFERLRGEGRHHIDYRHVIWSLVRKPGAFARYRFRDSLFPRQCFRRAHEALELALPERQATLEYLRILHLAATTVEHEVAAALDLLGEAGAIPRLAAVQALLNRERDLEIPTQAVLVVDVTSYDSLIATGAGQ
jgi:hypothetical protein